MESSFFMPATSWCNCNLPVMSNISMLPSVASGNSIFRRSLAGFG